MIYLPRGFTVFCSYFIFSGLKSKDATAPRGKKDAVNPRKRFSDIEISALDNVYLTSKGKPSKAVIEATAKTLKLEERQVNAAHYVHDLMVAIDCRLSEMLDY